MIRFTDYAKISNNCCICYFGQSDEYLVQLRLLKPILEREFPEIIIHIACNDEKIHHLKNCTHTLKASEIKLKKNDFAYITEIKCNGVTHPIEDFLNKAGVNNCSIPTTPKEKTNKCVIITKGSFPTKSIDINKIQQIKKLTSGMDCELDTNISEAGLVIGVESVGLCEAASQGIETILIPTGVGARLYKKLFPIQKIVHI